MANERTPLFDQICSGYLMGKEDLVDELISAWKDDRTVASALFRAALVPANTVLSNEQWSAIRRKANEFLPYFPEEHHNASRVRVLIANRAGNVGDLLWDGRFDAARQMLLAGKGRRTRFNMSLPKTEPRRATRGIERGTVFVKARALSKKRDWKTVK